MAKITKSVTLAEDDIKLLLKLKKDLLHVDGPLSDIAVVRKALRSFAKTLSAK